MGPKVNSIAYLAGQKETIQCISSLQRYLRQPDRIITVTIQVRATTWQFHRLITTCGYRGQVLEIVLLTLGPSQVFLEHQDVIKM